MTYYKQYKDLYMQAQTDSSKGKYKIFLFDIKESKIHSTRDGLDFYTDIKNFTNKTTTDLLKLEKIKGHKILHRHLEVADLKENEQVKDKVVLLRHQNDTKFNKSIFRYDQFNPVFWMGDLIHFIIERDSVSDSEFMQFIQKNKDSIIPNYDLHFASGYYETDVWYESSKKFSRVYCIPVLDELSKKSKHLITSPNKFKTTTEKEL